MGTFEEQVILKNSRIKWDNLVIASLIGLFASWTLGPVNMILGIGLSVLFVFLIWLFSFLSDRHLHRQLELYEINKKKESSIRGWRRKDIPMDMEEGMEEDLVRAKYKARIARDMQDHFPSDDILLGRYKDLEYDSYRTLERAKVI